MTEQFNIENISSYREDNRIEAKKAKSQLPDSIWATYSSFANTDGEVEEIKGHRDRYQMTLILSSSTHDHSRPGF